MIPQLYTRATGKIVPNTAETTLLSILTGLYKSIKKGLLWHWLTAARMVIPCYWQMAHAPTLIERVMEMDHIELDTYEQFYQNWLPWKLFRESSEIMARVKMNMVSSVNTALVSPFF